MKIVVALVGLMLSLSAAGQQSNPYAGQQTREIKALSPAEIQSYLAGRGMGLAKAAELNGYPGPKHVLELADELSLTAEQRQTTKTIFDRMHAEAVRLGEAIVVGERELDEAFTGDVIEAEVLQESLMELGRLKARLRYVHLVAHLEQRALLSEKQVVAYRELRGYAQGRAAHDHGHP